VRTVESEHSGGGKAGLFRFVQGLDQRLEPAGIRCGIVVEERRIRRRHVGKGAIVGGGKAQVFLQGDQANLGEAAGYERRRIIGGPVVDQGDRKGPVRLRSEALDAVLQEFLSVPVDDDDVDLF